LVITFNIINESKFFFRFLKLIINYFLTLLFHSYPPFPQYVSIKMKTNQGNLRLYCIWIHLVPPFIVTSYLSLPILCSGSIIGNWLFYYKNLIWGYNRDLHLNMMIARWTGLCGFVLVWKQEFWDKVSHWLLIWSNNQIYFHLSSD